jgi:hypothetical protein
VAPELFSFTFFDFVNNRDSKCGSPQILLIVLQMVFNEFSRHKRYHSLFLYSPFLVGIFCLLNRVRRICWEHICLPTIVMVHFQSSDILLIMLNIYVSRLMKRRTYKIELTVKWFSSNNAGKPIIFCSLVSLTSCFPSSTNV